MSDEDRTATRRAPGRGDPERIAALHAQMAEQVTALREGPEWAAWLEAAARFHDYSFNNVVLILAQRPDATAVAGYQRWRTFGRQVERGEKGIAILAPVVRRTDRTDPADDGGRAAGGPSTGSGPTSEVSVEGGADTAPGRARVAGFRVTHVWDVTQTSGTPLPVLPRPQLLAGQAPDGLWDRLVAAIADHGYTVERGDCGTANGVTHPATATVRVRADVDDAQAVKTLAHELGHVLLHTGPGTDGVPACRGTAEVEAESLAYIVATSHGMDTSAYTFPYLATWATTVEGSTPEAVIRASGARVVTAAHDTLVRLQPPVPTPSSTTPDPTARVLAGAQRTAQLRDAVIPPPLADQTAGTTRRALGASSRPEVGRAALTAVHQDAHTFFRNQVDRSWVPVHLAARALPAAGAAPWAAGYAPASWTALSDHLRSLGWSDAVLETAGLARRARTGALVDHFRDRLVLPVHDPSGALVAFVGRAPTGALPEVPKYLNTPATEVYRKTEVLYGLHQAGPALAAGAVPVLVEGPLDAIAVTTATSGRYAGLAPCGTALSEQQVAHLAAAVDLRTRGLVVATDGDAAGQKAAARAYDLLAPHSPRLSAADLGAGSDPADHHHRHGPASLTSALAERSRPLLEVAVDARLEPWAHRLRWVEGRVGAARAAAPLLARLDVGLRADQVHQLARRLALEPATVLDLVHTAAQSSLPSVARAYATRTPDAPAVLPTSWLRSTVRPPPPPAPVHSRRAR